MEGITTRAISNTDGTVRTRDGRQIGYGEFGDPDGKPVILCHGFGDSRLTRNPDDELTARLGIRLITVDRPGIGLTDPMKELTLIDRVTDIEELADALKLDRFAVLGWSGGAPFALAAAYELGDRVTRVGIAAGFGPFERSGFRRLAPKEIRRVILILKAAPWMSGMLAKESAKQLHGDTHAMSNGDALASSSDAALLARGLVRENISRGAEEAFRQGHEGVAADMLLVFRFKWGFRPEDVDRPVELWYGDEDLMTPVEVGRGLASLLPDARLRVSPGAGHLLHIRSWEDILQTLTGERAAPVRVAEPWVAPVVAQPVVAEPAVPEPAAAEPAAAEPASVAAAGDALTEDAIAATLPATGDADTAQDVETAAVTQDDAVTAEAPQGEAPAATVAMPAEAAPSPPRPAAPFMDADERERLRAAGFLVEEEEPEAVAAPEDAWDTGEAPAVAVGGEAALADAVVAMLAVDVERQEEGPLAAEVPIAEAEPAVTGASPEGDVVAGAPEEEPVAAASKDDVVTVEAAVDEAMAEPVSAAPPAEASTAQAAEMEAESAQMPAASTETASPPLDADERARLRAAGFPVDDEEAEAVAEAAEEIVEAAVVAEPEVPVEATAETQEPVEAAVASGDDADAGLSAETPTEETVVVYEEVVEVVAEDEAPTDAAAEKATPVEAAVTSGDDLPAADAGSVDAPVESASAPEVEPAEPAAHEVLRAAGFFVGDAEGAQPAVAHDKSEAAGEGDTPVAEASGAPGEAKDADAPKPKRRTRRRRSEAAVLAVEAAVPPVEAALPAVNEAGTGSSTEPAAQPAAGVPDEIVEAAALAESEAPVESTAEPALTGAESDEEQRADQLTQRLEELADRYVLAAEANRGDADVHDDAGDEAGSGEVVVHELADDAVAERAPDAVVAEAGAQPDAVAGQPEPEPEREPHPVPEDRHDDVARSDSEGGVAEEADPMLERLKAAGFAVLDAVPPGGR